MIKPEKNCEGRTRDNTYIEYNPTLTRTTDPVPVIWLKTAPPNTGPEEAARIGILEKNPFVPPKAQQVWCGSDFY